MAPSKNVFALSSKAISEFNALHKSIYGIELSEDDARLHATDLIDLLWSLLPNKNLNQTEYENKKTQKRKTEKKT